MVRVCTSVHPRCSGVFRRWPCGTPSCGSGQTPQSRSQIEVEEVPLCLSVEQVSWSCHHAWELLPNPYQAEAVKNFPVPTSVSGVCQFLGLASYYRHYIGNFASLAPAQLDKEVGRVSVDWRVPSGLWPAEGQINNHTHTSFSQLWLAFHAGNRHIHPGSRSCPVLEAAILIVLKVTK